MADLRKMLDDLHSGLAKQLLDRIESGEATASDLNVARQFLKDNGIDSVPAKGSPMQKLTDALPFTQNDDEDVAQPLPN